MPPARTLFNRISALAGSALFGFGLAGALLVAVWLAGGHGQPAFAAPEAPGVDDSLSPSVAVTCSATTVTHTRHLDFWYGSTLAAGSAISDVTELTDHVSQTGANFIYVSNSDQRIKLGVGAWISGTDDMAWVLAASENLSAETNLRGRLASVALPQPFVTTRFDQIINHGTMTYTLTNWTTLDGGCLVNHIGQAEVSYSELNAHALQFLFLAFVHR